MLRRKPIWRARRQAVAGALFVVAAGVCLPRLAQAHFILVTPDSWMSQDALGLPEKLGPCGDEGGGKATGKVTTFHPGETISITINEVIPHPGHYRVALAVNDRNELPSEPKVTPAAGDQCGSVAVENPPAFPILADNLLVHTQPFTMPQTFAVTLPSDVTCNKCTLQVLEYMSHHSAPCFYHHCADIAIQAEPATATATPPAPTPTVTEGATAASTSTPTETATLTPTPMPTVTLTLVPTPTSTPESPPTPSVVCAGDCDGSGEVTIEEIITLVNIALDVAPVGACAAGDENADQQITIDEILAAVSNAITGCPAS
ncbi:MAG: lytic polysaccharide monooxygenase [Deltaproteobacteria bacterium]|nr:lytic polysaccharide monooxygenase [Deltaproteobacteria bacterium]